MKTIKLTVSYISPGEQDKGLWYSQRNSQRRRKGHKTGLTIMVGDS